MALSEYVTVPLSSFKRSLTLPLTVDPRAHVVNAFERLPFKPVDPNTMRKRLIQKHIMSTTKRYQAYQSSRSVDGPESNCHSNGFWTVDVNGLETFHEYRRIIKPDEVIYWGGVKGYWREDPAKPGKIYWGPVSEIDAMIDTCNVEIDDEWVLVNDKSDGKREESYDVNQGSSVQSFLGNIVSSTQYWLGF